MPRAHPHYSPSMADDAPLHARIAHRARRRLVPHVRMLLHDAGFAPTPVPPPTAPSSPAAGIVAPPGGQLIALDYATDPTPRWGYDRPPHRLLAQRIEARHERYAENLGSFLAYADELAAIPVDDPGDARTPCWRNNSFPGLDVVALYSFMARERPQRYIEVGSGSSTRVARAAIDQHGLPTRITSIDPHPAVDIDQVCDVVHRTQLEKLDLALFEELEAGDVLFIDGTHRTFMNSDVTVALLEILPSLPAGVLVQIHDIRLPWDYPAAWGERYYSEQYVLAGFVLARQAPFEIELPNWHVSTTPALARLLQPLWSRIEGIETHGESFWLRTT